MNEPKDSLKPEARIRSLDRGNQLTLPKSPLRSSMAQVYLDSLAEIEALLARHMDVDQGKAR